DPESLGSLIRPLFEAVDATHLSTAHGRISLVNVLVSSDGLLLTELILGELVPPEAYEADADFAAPEVLAGENPDIRADVYSLGRVVKALIANAGLELPSSNVADDLREVLATATAQEPGERFETATAFGRALLKAIGVDPGASAEDLDPSYRARRKTDPGMPGLKKHGQVADTKDATGLAALIAGAVEEEQSRRDADAAPPQDGGEADEFAVDALVGEGLEPADPGTTDDADTPDAQGAPDSPDTAAPSRPMLPAAGLASAVPAAPEP